MWEVDTIGFYGPVILVFINIINLWTQRTYLVGYILFVSLNSVLNFILKTWIKQERPSKNGISIRHITDGYGMPSAHAQSTMFSIIYLFLVNGSYAWLSMGIGILILTIYQRWKSKSHTMEQLAVGSLVGMIFSTFSYRMTYIIIRAEYNHPTI